METLPGVSTSGGEFSAFSVRGGRSGSPRFSDIIAKTTTELSLGTKFSVLVLFAPEAFDRTEEDVLEGEFDELQVVDGEEDKTLIGTNWRVLTSDCSFVEATVYGQRTKGEFEIGKARPGEGEDGREPQTVSDVQSRQTSFLERKSNRAQRAQRLYLAPLNQLGSGLWTGGGTRTDFDELFRVDRAGHTLCL